MCGRHFQPKWRYQHNIARLSQILQQRSIIQGKVTLRLVYYMAKDENRLFLRRAANTENKLVRNMDLARSSVPTLDESVTYLLSILKYQ